LIHRAAFLACLFIASLLCGCARSEFEVDREITASRNAAGPPEDRPFWWGVSTSSYQTEDAGPAAENLGFKTDWDLACESGFIDHARGQGTWSYSQVERDIAAMKSIGVTHYRFSVEWARVEPRPGEFNEAAIAHYANVARTVREAGIEPVVTLWHFTFPSWLSSESYSRHGWLHPRCAERWGPFVRKMVGALAPHVETFAPQNEPNAYAFGVLIQYFPPGGRPSYRRYLRILDAEAEAFIEAAKIIREIRADARVISVQSIIHWKKNLLDVGRFWYRKGLEYNYYHLDRIVEACDWIGINYYFREMAWPLSRWSQAMRRGRDVSEAGWYMDADGLAVEIAALSRRYGKPILITENGVPDKTDRTRQRYLMDHVFAVRRAIAQGHDVRGYFHWSLMDNYEWASGYEANFGLFAVDPRSRALVPKESARLFCLFATCGKIVQDMESIPAR